MQSQMQLPSPMQLRTNAAHAGSGLRKHLDRFENQFTLSRGRCEPVFRGIIAQYGELYRRYYDAAYLVNQLDILEDLRCAKPALFANRDESLAIELAVLDGNVCINKEWSAGRALEHARALGLSEEVGMRARSMVLATRYVDYPRETAMQIITDIDLAPLAAPWDVFETINRRITEEGRLSGHDLMTARCELLEKLERQKQVFSTPYFMELEVRARTNVARWVYEQTVTA